MSRTTRTADDRGQVGIETLIIFIAMILVAAIAASILINTAGFLQNKAEATSHDSTEQVSNQVIALSAIGQVDASGTNVTALNVTVMLSPGADEIDLAEATIEYVGPHGSDSLRIEPPNPGGPPPCVTIPDCAIVTPLRDLDASVPVLNDRGDRFRVDVALNATGNSPAVLQEGEEATVRIVTQSGSVYTCGVNVPESLASNPSSGVGRGC